MTADEVLVELERLGSAQTKKTFLRHGATEPLFGVKVGDLKVVQKRVKGDHRLALDLYDTGNSDAMYLAGLVADPAKMTKAQLQKWVKAAYWYMLANYTVAGVAAESPFGWELGLEWIDSPKEMVASAGWSTLGGVASITPDEDLDLKQIQAILQRVRRDIHASQNRVKQSMNGFVIAVGGYVPPLLAKAKQTAKAIGKVEVDVGDTDCKAPLATDSIAKIESMGRVGKKRASARC